MKWLWAPIETAAIKPPIGAPSVVWRRSSAMTAGLITAGLVGLAALNRYLAYRAERDNPPKGSFVTVGNQRLHYIERGSGPAVVLLHGNGSMVEDFLCSGLIDELAQTHRVIVFDRPGFGHSPEHTDHSPQAQADSLADALIVLGVDTAVLFGHSWGSLVAITLAGSFKVKATGLVLVSGYYLQTRRPGILAGSLAALPPLGVFLSHTVLPWFTRAMWPLALRALFGPRSAKSFERFPKAMACRPGQLHSSLKETALLNPSTNGLAKKCRSLACPIVILAGAEDRIVDPIHAVHLQAKIPGAQLELLPHQGHMLHHTALGHTIAAIQRLGKAGN